MGTPEDAADVVVPKLPPEAPPVSWHRQARAAAWRALPRKVPAGFLLYGQGRTGSNLLGDLLACHPSVRFGNERLAARVRRPLAYIEGLRAEHAPSVYGVHVKRYHLTDIQDEADPKDWLSRAHDRGWRIVHLQRENLLRHVLSNFSLNATRVSHRVEGDDYQRPRLHVAPEDIVSWMAIRARILELELSDLSALPHVTVVYERDLLPGQPAWDATAGRVFSHLGLPPHAVTTQLRKVNEGTLGDLLDNADEVLDAVRRTRWAHLVED